MVRYLKKIIVQESVMLSFCLISAPVIWLLSGLGLLLVELATPGLFFFISFAFGCLFGALGAVLGYSLVVQCSVALLVSIIQFTSMRRALRRFTDTAHVPTNVQALAGKRAVVVVAITPEQTGQVKIGGEQWAATAHEKVAVEELVNVVKVEGNKVVVKKIKERA